MKNNWLEFLYGASQVDEAIEDVLTDDFAALLEQADSAEAESLAADKTTLSAALKAIGINSSGLQEDPEGFALITDDRDQYIAAINILSDPDSMHELCKRGWVASKCGDQAMTNENPEFKLRFLEIATTSGNDKDTAEEESTIIKNAREFASEEPEHDDENPVDHEAPDGNKLKKVTVGEPTDGEKPKGTIKDSLNADELVASMLEDCGQPGSKLKQPANGGKVPHAFKSKKKK
jgi:hypothetical protein